MFKYNFKIKSDFISARLYIVGLGYFSSEVNRIKTDDCYYKPLLTDFDRRKLKRNSDIFDTGNKTITYYTYDITDILKIGNNELSVFLGNGYYNNEEKTLVDESFSYGKPKLMFEIHIQYKNCCDKFYSSKDCKVCNTNRKSLMFGGDFIDFRNGTENEVFARECSIPSGKLISPQTKADRICKEYLVHNITKHPCGNTIYDFGENHTGGLNLRIKGEKGIKITIKYAEVIQSDGALNYSTGCWNGYDRDGNVVYTIYQKDEFILSGEIDEILPLFCFHCYRFVEISSEGKYEIIEIKSLFIHTDLKNNFNFHCSSEILEKISSVFLQTQLCNMHSGVSTDCPHREKLPYTGDMQLTCEAALYMLDAENFYSKCLNDIIIVCGLVLNAKEVF